MDLEDTRYQVLFLCQRNATRGILAEALLNTKGRERFRACSAGTRPAGTVNHQALELLKRLDLPTQSLRSKSWDEFAGPDAPQMDFIFSLCDKTAAEPCPHWPGKPVTGNWSIPDPSLVEGTEIEKANAYRDVFNMLERRISLFLSLPLESIDHLSMTQHFREADAHLVHRPHTAVLRPAAREV